MRVRIGLSRDEADGDLLPVDRPVQPLVQPLGQHQVVTGTKTTTSNSATFSPMQNLAPSTTYTATVTATAANGVTMAAPSQWSFTTGRPPSDPGVCPCSVFDDQDQPTGAPFADGSDLRLGMAFRADTAGMITGVRFFKAPGGAAPHDVYLYSSVGAEIAKATSVSEASSGWQEVSFAAPVAIDANTTYVAAYRASDGKYYGTSGGLGSVSMPHRCTPCPRVADTSTAPSDHQHLGRQLLRRPGLRLFGGQPSAGRQDLAGRQRKSVPVTAQLTVTFDGQIKSNTAKITVKRVSDGQIVAGNAGTETGGSTVSFTPTSPCRRPRSTRSP